MFFRRRKRRITRRRTASVSQHYKDHKELAREILHERLVLYNEHYGFTYKRVAIRNQRTCWGSCSEHGNLNFNYKAIFLPETLMDYIVVHELCHIKELNHSPDFWKLVAETVPDYRERRNHLKKMTHIPNSGFPSSVAQNRIAMLTSSTQKP